MPRLDNLAMKSAGSCGQAPVFPDLIRNPGERGYANTKVKSIPAQAHGTDVLSLVD